MSNIPDYKCETCGLVHMVCKQIDPKSRKKACSCGLKYHAFELKDGRVLCITEDEYRRQHR